MRHNLIGSSVLLIILSSISGNTFAYNWSVHNVKSITNHNTANVTAGENGIWFKTRTDSPHVIYFDFYNTCVSPATVGRIVFDFPSEIKHVGSEMWDLHIDSMVFDFIDSPTLLFPGTNNITPVFHNEFELGKIPDLSSTAYGLHRGQILHLKLFVYMPDTYNVENAINTGAFRIGFYSTFSNGGNESFVSIPVPEPLTIVFIGLGSLMLRKQGKKI